MNSVISLSSVVHNFTVSANSLNSIWTVSGELGITQSSVGHHLYCLGQFSEQQSVSMRRTQYLTVQCGSSRSRSPQIPWVALGYYQVDSASHSPLWVIHFTAPANPSSSTQRLWCELDNSQSSVVHQFRAVANPLCSPRHLTIQYGSWLGECVRRTGYLTVQCGSSIYSLSKSIE